ncbi:Uncharacterized membrane protein YsdA, DUF1294 family [Lachnospiraceae bacterium KH1T2]|nr:Uncharacterized membrane protein YsdA, DUF1294 family [Lachnospiraceae bacterium KH1T2]
MFNEIFIIYILLINIIAFTMYGLDKRKAKRHVWRTPEATLIGVAAIGGSIGALCGMQFFHHKTKHLKFRISLPLILIVHIVILYFYRKFIA